MVARTINIDISIVAPAIAVVLEDVPARKIGKEPSFADRWSAIIRFCDLSPIVGK